MRGFISRIGGLAACVGSLAAPASAATLVATFNGTNPSVDATVSINAGVSTSNVRGGLFHWTATGGTYTGVTGDFNTFCIEVTENVAGGNSYTYDVLPPALGPTTAPMGAARADRLAELLGRFLPGLNLTDADQVGGFQLAVWNLVYDTDNTILAGQFQASDGPGPMFYADFYLGAIDGLGPRIYADALLAEGIQDQIVIPEPASLLLLGLALLARRRP